MNLRLSILSVCFPLFLKKRKLAELHTLTASAFGKEQLELRMPTFEEGLRRYALFTREAAEAALSNQNDPTLVRKTLYEKARAWGALLRKELSVKTAEDARRALRLIYGAIRIDLEVKVGGDVIIRRCFFSDYYGPKVCVLISALDEGLVAGLTGGARLELTQRITEGKECCLGRLGLPGAGS